MNIRTMELEQDISREHLREAANRELDALLNQGWSILNITKIAYASAPVLEKIDYTTLRHVTLIHNSEEIGALEERSDHYIAKCTALETQIQGLRRMLYHMTSLTDWMTQGYSEDEYNALVKEFENA